MLVSQNLEARLLEDGWEKLRRCTPQIMVLVLNSFMNNGLPEAIESSKAEFDSTLARDVMNPTQHNVFCVISPEQQTFDCSYKKNSFRITGHAM